ncbi:hypothetical protein AB0F15_05025 [Amycolatopsis sp. NPDC026612]|uniref:hypothetical protein n=1 Tax=Amycolatopsis sp. NPDC026612 TaxID=3155466 RepID=UPI0033CF51F1
MLNIYGGFLKQILDPKNPVVHDVDPPTPSPLLPAQASAWDNCGGGVLRDDFNGGTRRTGYACDASDSSAQAGGRSQNLGNRLQLPVSVVGSRACGAAGPLSDWDYVTTGIDLLSGMRRSERKYRKSLRPTWKLRLGAA